MKYSWLPPMLADVAEAAGLDAALALATAAGGRRVTIPARAKNGHWLVEAVGREAADKICAHFRTINADGRETGARQIVIPMGPGSVVKAAKRQLARNIEAGMTVRKAAQAAGMHERTGFRVKRRLDGRDAVDPNQTSLLDLFEQPSKASR